MKEFKFNNEYFRKYIKKGKMILQNNSLDDKNKNYIITDINFFKNCIYGNFEGFSDEDKTNEKNSITILKELFLKDCKKHFYMLGTDTIDFIIKLKKEQVFLAPVYCESKPLSIDEQAELTIKNYEKNSKYGLNIAKRIINSNNPPQIQKVDSLACSSYCHFSDIAELPFLIVDPEEQNNIFNHEIQHAIEYTLNINKSKIYSELGAIYFELLFNDVALKERGYIYSTDCIDRIDEACMWLNELYPYFVFLKAIHRNNFNVSDQKFEELCFKYLLIPKNKLINRIKRIIEYKDYDAYICYLLSFLKAIELREKTTKQDSMDLLVPYFSRKTNIGYDDSKFPIYKRYIKEINDINK